MMLTMTSAPIILLLFVLFNILNCTESYDMAHIASGYNSAFECAADNLQSGELESRCGLCVICEKSEEKSVFMREKNGMNPCPRPGVQAAETGKIRTN